MCPVRTWAVCLATPVLQTYGICCPLRSEVKSLGNLKACTEITRSVHQRLLERKHERLPLKLYKTANYFKKIFKPFNVLSYNKKYLPTELFLKALLLERECNQLSSGLPTPTLIHLTFIYKHHQDFYIVGENKIILYL